MFWFRRKSIWPTICRLFLHSSRPFDRCKIKLRGVVRSNMEISEVKISPILVLGLLRSKIWSEFFITPIWYVEWRSSILDSRFSFHSIICMVNSVISHMQSKVPEFNLMIIFVIFSIFSIRQVHFSFQYVQCFQMWSLEDPAYDFWLILIPNFRNWT